MPSKRAWERRDPEAKAEARKYAHPVPTRRYIRQYLEDQGVPVPFDELVKAFGLDRQERNAHSERSRRFATRRPPPPLRAA
jgi:ribonuclease R